MCRADLLRKLYWNCDVELNANEHNWSARERERKKGRKRREGGGERAKIVIWLNRQIRSQRFWWVFNRDINTHIKYARSNVRYVKYSESISWIYDVHIVLAHIHSTYTGTHTHSISFVLAGSVSFQFVHFILFLLPRSPAISTPCHISAKSKKNSLLFFFFCHLSAITSIGLVW